MKIKSLKATSLILSVVLIISMCLHLSSCFGFKKANTRYEYSLFFHKVCSPANGDYVAQPTEIDKSIVYDRLNIMVEQFAKRNGIKEQNILPDFAPVKTYFNGNRIQFQEEDIQAIRHLTYVRRKDIKAKTGETRMERWNTESLNMSKETEDAIIDDFMKKNNSKLIEYSNENGLTTITYELR